MRILTEDAGDRWHVVGELGDGRRIEVWVPKTAEDVDHDPPLSLGHQISSAQGGAAVYLAEGGL